MLDTILERWLSGDQHLNAPVRCGLVVCIPFLRPALRAALAPELARLLQCASEDDDAWVRILARALGTNPQRTDLDAVAADVPPVRAPQHAAAHAARRTRWVDRVRRGCARVVLPCVEPNRRCDPPDAPSTLLPHRLARPWAPYGAPWLRAKHPPFETSAHWR